MPFKSVQYRPAAWHFVFWLLFFLYTWLPEGNINDNYYAAFLSASGIVPIVIAATYYTIYITFERFFLRKKLWQFVLSLIGSLIVTGIIRRYFLYTTMYPILYPARLSEPLFYAPKMMVGAVQVHLIAGVGTLIYLLGKWKEQQHLAFVLVKEKVAAELELLKSQVQPHFIFNTLNNIYMLSLKGSTQTSDMIYRLSSLLSYMLYDSKEDTIPIEKEVDYIKNYINLEKIRYGDRLDVQFNVYHNVKGVHIPPLLMLPLVENAFKHGVSKQVNDSWIHIDMSIKNSALIFKIENSCSEEAVTLKEFGHGLGLTNLQKRLLILFPDRFELKTLKEDDTFLAILKIDLKEDKSEYYYTEGVSGVKKEPQTSIASPIKKEGKFAATFKNKPIFKF